MVKTVRAAPWVPRPRNEAADVLGPARLARVVRNLKVGRDEIDILAVDPGPPPTLVVVEVRSLRTAAFGAPEERVDRRKVGHLYRALGSLGSFLETEEGVGRLPRRVDLVIVDRRSGRAEIRHLRRWNPPDRPSRAAINGWAAYSSSVLSTTGASAAFFLTDSIALRHDCLFTNCSDAANTSPLPATSCHQNCPVCALLRMTNFKVSLHVNLAVAHH